MSLWFDFLLDILTDFLPFPGSSEKENEGIRNLIKWRNGELSKQDETQIASDRNYLLIASADSLYLIHRHKRWKGKLDPYAESLFKQRGAKAFRRMHKHLGKHE